jgi:hypothetical protein
MPVPTTRSTHAPTLISWIYVLILIHCFGVMGWTARTAGANKRSGGPRRRPRSSDCKLKPLPPDISTVTKTWLGEQRCLAEGQNTRPHFLKRWSHRLAPPISYRPLPLITHRTGSLFAHLPARPPLTTTHLREAMWVGAPHFWGHQLHFLPIRVGIGGTLFDDDYKFSPNWLTGR